METVAVLEVEDPVMFVPVTLMGAPVMGVTVTVTGVFIGTLKHCTVIGIGFVRKAEMKTSGLIKTPFGVAETGVPPTLETKS